MDNYNSNYDIALQIGIKVGIEQIDYDSSYSICRAIHKKLTGTDANFDSTYSILNAIYRHLGGAADDFDSVYSVLEAINVALGGDSQDDIYDVLLDILDNYGPVPPTPTTYTVSYNANTGQGTMVDSNSPYASGATVTVLSNTFTKDGYTFDGWNTSADGTGTSYVSGQTFIITGNTTLYAQWEEIPVVVTFTMSYSNNGGEGTMTDSNSPYESGATVTVLSNTFTKEGYTFEGWNTSSDGTGTSYAAGGTFTITADTTLYAQWEEIPVVTFTMSYNNNGGEGTMTDSNSPYESGATVTILGNTFTRSGYTFDCWNTSADGTGTSYTSGDTFAITADTTLYAQWEVVPEPTSGTVLVLIGMSDRADNVLGINSAYSGRTIWYSLDEGSTWTEWSDSATTVTVGSGETIYLRGKTTGTQDGNNYLQFNTATGKFNVSGYARAIDDYEADVNAAIPEFAFYNLFSYCRIEDASQLQMPSLTVGHSSYSRMFSNVGMLTAAPSLPATALSSGSYSYMFKSCTSLTQAPALPATTLATRCYEEMFRGCTNITSAPVLPAESLATDCYNLMFNGCSKLDYIECHATDSLSATYSNSWVANVAADGVFARPIGVSHELGPNGIPSSWNVLDIPASVKFTAHASSTIGLAGISSHQTLEYSTDGSTWTPMTTATTISVSSGDSVYVRGLLSGANGSSDYTQFAISGDVHVSGLLDALFSKNESIPDMLNGDVELKDYCAYGLFLGCTGLTSASGLIMNAKSVPSNGYCTMFRNCNNLASVPALPATTLGINCYSNMFRNCTSMTSAPSLPATSLASGCYSSMFRNCSSITTAPELPATTLAENCYNAMFYECSGMTVAPVLNAPTLAAGSYQNMFGSCSSLSAITCMATDISASACTSNWVSGVSASGVFKKDDSMSGWTTGASGIPSGWTIKTKPTVLCITALENNTKVQLRRVFTGHTLQYSTDEGDTWNTANTQQISLSKGGTIYYRGTLSKAPGSSSASAFQITQGDVKVSGNLISFANYQNPTTLAYNYSLAGLFSGCTAVSDISEATLPATTLKNYCYSAMFRGCNKITKAPVLPAETLVTYCYQNMFNGCSLLNDVTMLAVDTSASSCLSSWLSNVASSGTFRKNALKTDLPSGSSGIPTGWTVVDYA